MFGFEAKAILHALSESLCIIEFDPNGRIITANANFCHTIGYGLSEIVGRHHSMFVSEAFAQTQDYKDFWKKLGAGEFDAREYRRIGKGGREIWIQASYNPVKTQRGAVIKVVKVATDITAEKLRNAEFEAKISAISRVQGIIEFTPDGHIITANENFLGVIGYRLDEIQGKSHQIFVHANYAQSAEYQDFWRKLNRGEFISQEFTRIAKGGKEIWIQASYNPVFDLSNRVTKIVKFATDISDRVRAIRALGLGLANLANHNLEYRIDLPDNNVEYRIDTTFTPTFEKLRSDFNTSLEGLYASMVKIAGSTDAIQSGAREITTASDDLSRRTEQQAASLEETAAALDQITLTVRVSADGAAHARQVVASADGDAQKSAIVVRQAVQAMGGIAESARKISQIIGVIDEIAFQTNLLALNAGVEAARAGDAGRGFAVVASEVRALAQRSAEAAKEIKGLIAESSTQVDQGVKLVAETGSSLERIMGQVKEINDVVSSIAAGAKEQSVGLSEVNTAITQMDQVTQQNAAMVEESTAASHSLSSEASQLSNLVGQFKLGQAKRDAPDAWKSPAPQTFRAPAAERRYAKREHSVVNAGAIGREAGGWQDF